MGERVTLFQTSFNRAVSIEARPERLTSHAGALLMREVMERTGVVDWLTGRLRDGRDPSRIRYPLGDLVRTVLSLFGQGLGDLDDADRLRSDPGLGVAVSSRRGDAPVCSGSGLASQPTLSRLVGMLKEPGNLAVLREGVTEYAGRRIGSEGPTGRVRQLVVDVDGLPVEVHGEQAGSAWNGHYRQRMFHALVASSGEYGDLLEGTLRSGAAPSTEGVLEMVLRLAERLRGRYCRSLLLRMDAGFADGKTMAGLESQGLRYVMRLKNNAILNRWARPHLRRPPGRPPREGRVWFYEKKYAAGSWARKRRVVLVVVEVPGQLFLRHFWLVTNLKPSRWPAAALLALYRKRGKAESHMGELMSELAPALSSSPRPKSCYRGRKLAPAATGDLPDPETVDPANEVLFLLHLLAYQLLHTGRRLMETTTGTGWSLRRFRERLLSVAARALLHARRVTFSIQWSALDDWQRFWRRLDRLDWAFD